MISKDERYVIVQVGQLALILVSCCFHRSNPDDFLNQPDRLVCLVLYQQISTPSQSGVWFLVVT